jgi:vitellogenic carboxypeptidase-like protein
MTFTFPGIAVGNGWTDPVSMLDRSSFLYQVGLVDRKTRDEMHNMEQKTVQLIKSHDYEEATRVSHEGSP